MHQLSVKSSVWSCHFGKTYINAEQQQVSALGHVLEVTHLGRELHTQLDAQPQVSWFCPDHIEQFTSHPDSVVCKLASGEELHTRLVLACDGGRSNTREQFAITTHTESYEQTALIANISVEQGFEERAFERFTDLADSVVAITQQTLFLWCHHANHIQQFIAYQLLFFSHFNKFGSAQGDLHKLASVTAIVISRSSGV